MRKFFAMILFVKMRRNVRVSFSQVFFVRQKHYIMFIAHITLRLTKLDIQLISGLTRRQKMCSKVLEFQLLFCSQFYILFPGIFLLLAQGPKTGMIKRGTFIYKSSLWPILCFVLHAPKL